MMTSLKNMINFLFSVWDMQLLSEDVLEILNDKTIINDTLNKSNFNNTELLGENDLAEQNVEESEVVNGIFTFSLN